MRAVRLAALLSVVLLLAAFLTGCFTPSDRPAKLQALARWQDLRLAPGDSLAAMLADGDAHVRLAAARAAGLIGRDDVVPNLLDLADDGSQTVAAEAAWALGLVGDTEAVPTLARLSADARPVLRHAAVRALAHVANDGTALLAAADHDDATTAALAWNALRNRAADVDAAALREAVVAGLARPEADVRWRVLRCSEMIADSTLVPVVAPFTRDANDQVVVHAYRALARLAPGDALPAVLAGLEHLDGFRGRQADRTRIAACRALGAVGSAGLEGDDKTADRIAAFLVAAAGAESPHVARTALDAMARLVADRPLPPEAERQESLLPVWRIRLARVALQRLDAPHVGVRAAAVTAVGELRGAGAAGNLVAIAQHGETSPHVYAAAMTAVARHHPDPVIVLAVHTGLMRPRAAGDDSRPFNAMLRTAALQGLDHLRTERPEVLVAPRDSAYIEGLLLTASTDDDYVVATTAAGLLGGVPTDESLLALTTLWDRAAGPGRNDMRRGVLGGLRQLLAPTGENEAAPWQGPDSWRDEARRVLRESFDSHDIRLRREGREVAVATGLLPAELVPTERSLLATLPAVLRDPRQPAVAVPFAAPRLRCVTERGDFEITLDGDLAPNTCALFLSLVDDDYFGAMTFHRVVPDFVVQGGDPEGHGWGGPGFTIRSEWSPTPYDRTAVGIAHDGKDTGGSQFFVTLSPQPHLEGRYTIFGHVTSGMEVVDAIEVGDTFRLERMD